MAVNENNYVGFGPTTEGDGASHTKRHIAESADWEGEVYQIETSDYVVGGANGVVNLPHAQLAGRTQYLKARLEALSKKLDETTPGRVSDAITIGNFPGMRKATDREELYVYGGTTNKDGAAFGLRGVNCTEYGEELRGSFGIAAVHPSGAVHILNGLGNGSLLWDGINIGAGGIVAQSIGRNGYIKLGNGLILQWGYAEQKGVTPMLIAFPIAFPSLTLSLVFGEDAATNDMLETAQYVNLTNHGFTFYGSNITLGNLVPGPCKAFWLALGY